MFHQQPAVRLQMRRRAGNDGAQRRQAVGVVGQRTHRFVAQVAFGQVTVAGGTGVTLRSSGGKIKTAAQYSVISLRRRATDDWVISGDTG